MPKRTDIKSILIIGLCFCVQASPANALTYDSTCIEHESLLKCLKYDEKENTYGNHYDLSLHKEFYDVLDAAEMQAKKCNSPDKTAYFLNGIRITGDAELGEYFSEIVEVDFATNKSECLIKSFPKLDKKSQQTIIEILRNPTFIEPSQSAKFAPLIKKLTVIEHAQTH